MKSEIKKHQQFKAVAKILESHASEFAEKPDLQSAHDAFMANTTRIGEILSQLLRPVSTVITPKIDSESRMRKELSKMTGIGLSLATSLDNQPLLTLFKNYGYQCMRCSAYQLYEISLHVSNEFSAFGQAAADNGLTAEKLAAFRSMVDAYGEALDSTGYKLSDRRKSRQELQQRIKDNNRILKLQMDTFVRYLEDENPRLFSQYMFLRKRRYKRSRKGNGNEPADISGVVTDSGTGTLLQGAVITITTPETVVTTDADGYFLLDELEPGTFTIGCHLEGYEVPPAVTATAAAGESLVVNFELVAVQQQAA